MVSNKYKLKTNAPQLKQSKNTRTGSMECVRIPGSLHDAQDCTHSSPSLHVVQNRQVLLCSYMLFSQRSTQCDDCES